MAYDTERLTAIEQYMDKKNLELQDELDLYLQKLYEKYVPPLVREYIETREGQNAREQGKNPKPKPAPPADE